MTTSKELAEQYCNKIYQEAVDDVMYSPDVFQSKKDFIAGFSAKEKIIKDLYNKYNSIRRDEEHIKLTKTINTEKVNKLRIKLETLKELL